MRTYHAFFRLCAFAATAAISFVTSSSAGAQNFETAYFLDNYSYHHRINPAIQNKTNVASALLGNVEVFAASNAGISDFIFPKDGQLVSGLSKKVSAEEFLGKLQTMSSINTDINFNIGTAGFWVGGGSSYHTVELNVRAYADGNVPKELFEFLKVGGAREYDIEGSRTQVTAYTELAYGYSRALNRKWKVGARAKLLLGMGQMNIQADHLKASNIDGVLKVETDATMQVAQNSLYVDMNPDGTYSLDSLKVGEGGHMPGFGFGLDFGATYEPVEGLVVSLAVNDLGFIHWQRNINGKSAGAVEVSEYSSQMSGEVADRFKDLMKFRLVENTNGSTMLPFTVNAGARYAMPFYRKLSAGISLSYKNYLNPYFNGRLGATITPKEWFSFTANYGYGTYGHSFGTAFSISGGIFNFFTGIETYLGKRMSDIPAPVNRFKTAVTLGISFRFGGPGN